MPFADSIRPLTLSRASIGPTRTWRPTFPRNSINPSWSSQSLLVTTLTVPISSRLYPRAKAYSVPFPKNRSTCFHRDSNWFRSLSATISSRSVIRPEGSPTDAVALPIYVGHELCFGKPGRCSYEADGVVPAQAKVEEVHERQQVTDVKG